jgi:pyrroloquinoline quinone (PQQ) biosynthesis protein C
MNDFYTTLLAATAEERDALLAIPFIQRGWRGELGLESYQAFLAQAYHHVKHTTPLLMACGARVPQHMEWLRDALAHYIAEEVGHQEWILNDIAAAGGDPEAVRGGEPDWPADLMVAYAYDLIQRVNPAGFLGMVLVLEGTSVRVASEAAASLQRSLGLPKTAFSYLTSHGALDQSHMQFYAGVVNRLTGAHDQACVIHAARRFYRLYGDVFRALPLTLPKQAAA